MEGGGVLVLPSPGTVDLSDPRCHWQSRSESKPRAS